MSSTDRQNRLLVAEDWKRIYQSFRYADFQSYDFDNLRRTMINYLRQNYPEDFNDYIESSEYLALIDLIAFLGQNISFRIDLNARENFIELAERRESVLRLARLLSYNPKRNVPANGLLKFQSVTTTEDVRDSNGQVLSGLNIQWNDTTNPNWYEQFVKVLNAALPFNGVFGKPYKKDTVAGIQTEQYKFNAINTDIPVYSYSKTIDGSSFPFEVTSVDVRDGNIEEEIPVLGNNFGFLYRNDSKGAGSSNTGFFAHFRQGLLDSGDFSVTNPIPNQVVDVDTRNINNSDVWLYKLDDDGFESEFWTKVESVEGNNVIYNSVQSGIRDIYAVTTRADDRIGLVFADGTFGNLPKGNFRVYYRTSANQRLVIKPNEMANISITVPYISRAGKSEAVTITMNLQYTVDNSSTSETNESIKSSAPRNYYTQNRMVTAEDYNVAPLSTSQEIIKTKTVNRTSSGISRYFDLTDATGKYSNTNLFATDGILYKEFLTKDITFSYTTKTDVEGIVENTITPLLQEEEILNYYFDRFPRILTTDLNATWSQLSTETNQSTGIILDIDRLPYTVSSFASNQLRFVKPGSLVKFTAPEGEYFNTFDDNQYVTDATLPGAVSNLWAKVVTVNNDGTNTDNSGGILVNEIIPNGAFITVIIPRMPNALTDEIKTQVINQIFSNNPFGIRFDRNSGEWKVINENNIDLYGAFSTSKTGDNSNQQQDSSWIFRFITDGEQYTVTRRNLRYIFESIKQCRFYKDESNKIYDTKTGKVIEDQIRFLNVNRKPDSNESYTTDFPWEIVKPYRDAEGYVDSSKVIVTFFDTDKDGTIDNPDAFTEIVQPNTNTSTKYVFQEKYTTAEAYEDFRLIEDQSTVISLNSQGDLAPLTRYTDGQVFYFVTTNSFYVLDQENSRLNLSTDYKAFLGIDNIKFQYIHNADESSRIDPSSSNILDLYLLTKGYDTQYRQWLENTINAEPLPPSSDSLFRSYGTDLNKIKSVSDELIYHPVKYKNIFGNKADDTLQAKFKVVKNKDLVLNDNDIKARVISAINRFFALENWDFGETFYFSELSAFVMNELAPDINTFVIVPVQANKAFGTMYEIKCESDEIFISSATVDDVELIDAITASQLQVNAGLISTATATSNQNVTSS